MFNPFSGIAAIGASDVIVVSGVKNAATAVNGASAVLVIMEVTAAIVITAAGIDVIPMASGIRWQRSERVRLSAVL
ncbi:hypothetical protein SAMN03159496_05724 [Rhizobium sp. NFR07]|uniref:hypothetical protein n=1 Tax=Rhizobium sp. NFR07 TaxID=1566262 RepID=UPI0008F3DB34|nr:hypothetical protein SAMN03159496_05724 [Rhizobium sp. NFR07]